MRGDFGIKKQVSCRAVHLRCTVQTEYSLVIALVPLVSLVIIHSGDVVPIAFCSEMMHDTIQLICADRRLLFARNLDHWLNFHDIVDFSEVHVPFAEHKSFQVNDKDLGQ